MNNTLNLKKIVSKLRVKLYKNRNGRCDLQFVSSPE